jgi:polyphosphate kinase
VILELRARFDEEANLRWKRRLEEEGVKVIVGKPTLKVHSKLCLITKHEFGKIKHYGFVSTGNLNENTSKVYGDHCLLTANKTILAGIKNTFQFLENENAIKNVLLKSSPIIVSPTNTRNFFITLIKNEIKNFKKGKPAEIIIKLNSLSDEKCIDAIIDAANEGVKVSLIIRGIFCLDISKIKKNKQFTAISIVDTYLEHARVLMFANAGKPLVYISSADWMGRNLDHRVEASVAIIDANLQNELINILRLQLSENVKARLLNNKNPNEYVQKEKLEKICRSQINIASYLQHQTY